MFFYLGEIFFFKKLLKIDCSEMMFYSAERNTVDAFFDMFQVTGNSAEQIIFIKRGFDVYLNPDKLIIPAPILTTILTVKLNSIVNPDKKQHFVFADLF